ncbi:hypothetical protein LVJ94_27795 [Pendulispora rubella]|uniref:Uncharacterized protein n=1 Tax=Pendulispora rubella TaxID=2741070 RepID=A0ABZ2KUM7_9BACT
MDPFRNEQEAAHERIAQLEREKEELELRNRELASQLKQKRAAADPLRVARLAILMAVAIGCVTSTALFLGTLRRACLEGRDDPSSFRGIVVVPHPALSHSGHSPLLDKMPPPFEPPKPALDASACICAKGDPLCDCL